MVLTVEVSDGGVLGHWSLECVLAGDPHSAPPIPNKDIPVGFVLQDLDDVELVIIVCEVGLVKGGAISLAGILEDAIGLLVGDEGVDCCPSFGDDLDDLFLRFGLLDPCGRLFLAVFLLLLFGLSCGGAFRREGLAGRRGAVFWWCLCWSFGRSGGRNGFGGGFGLLCLGFCWH